MAGSTEIGEGTAYGGGALESQSGVFDPGFDPGLDAGVNQDVVTGPGFSTGAFFDLAQTMAGFNPTGTAPPQIDIEAAISPPDFSTPGDWDKNYAYDPPKPIDVGIPGPIGNKINDVLNNPITNLINAAVGFVPVLGIINTGAKLTGLPTVGQMVTGVVRGAIAGDISPYDIGNSPERDPTSDLVNYNEPMFVDKKYRLSDGRIITVPSYPDVKLEPVDFDPFNLKEPAVRG